MIKIFSPTDKTFASNGDVVLQAVKAKVHKEDNGEFYLSLETGIDYVDYLVEGNIVVAPTPQGDQAFRITNVTKTKSKLTTKAYHVFYDSENYLVASAHVLSQDCDTALSILNASTEPQSPFSVVSDIDTVHSYNCVRKSLYEAISEVMELWGGHLVRDNFSFGIMESIGHDNGITVQYKKNLQEITCSENWDMVVTKLLPVGNDGILLNAVDPSASIYLVSDTQYDIPYVKTVKFTQNISKENYPDEISYMQALVADLRTQALEYLDEHCVPQVSYTLKANLEKVTDIGDVVEVLDDRLGIDIMTTVIGFEYDCILGKYTQVEFGNFAKTISGFAGAINETINKTVTEQVFDSTSMLDAQIAEKVASPAQKAYSVGDYVIFNGAFCEVIDAISIGDLFVIGVNLEVTSIAAEMNKTNKMVYPIGSIYISVNNTNPQLLFGGTWQRIKDTFLLACGDVHDSGETGGEEAHTLTVNELPEHTHDLEYSVDDGVTWDDAVLGRSGAVSNPANLGCSDVADSASVYAARIKATGGGEAHNNMPPYLSVYMWKRTG